MANRLSCNLGSYRGHVDAAYRHLQEIGVKWVEIGIPGRDDVAQVMNRLALADLMPATVMASADIASEQFADQFGDYCEIAAKMSVDVIFTSIKAGDVPRETVYERLRAAGDHAAAYDVTIAMETHPDLMTNGDLARESLEAIDHPNIRMNFDTANIMYYNEGTATVDELQKVAPYVASVHLKDTTGGFKTWNFPALGQGVVDFPRVLSILRNVGFDGPWTMELEGVEGQQFTAEDACNEVAESVEYMRSIGVLM